jgi:hypothetical protein
MRAKIQIVYTCRSLTLPILTLPILNPWDFNLIPLRLLLRTPLPISEQKMPWGLASGTFFFRMELKTRNLKFHKKFLFNSSWDTTQESLFAYFSRYGEVIDCVVMKNSNTNRSRTYELEDFYRHFKPIMFWKITYESFIQRCS